MLQLLLRLPAVWEFMSAGPGLSPGGEARSQPPGGKGCRGGFDKSAYAKGQFIIGDAYPADGYLIKDARALRQQPQPLEHRVPSRDWLQKLKASTQGLLELNRRVDEIGRRLEEIRAAARRR